MITENGETIINTNTMEQKPSQLKKKAKKAILKAKIQDLKKARWYLDRKIEQLQSKLSKAKCR